jgi:N-acetylneuraminic acid mutarotase
MTVSAVGARIYAIGGGARIVAGRSVEQRRQLEAYDTATNRWSRAADMPTPRTVLSSSVVDGRIYVLGGVFSKPTSSTEELLRALQTLSVVEVYDPASGRWARARDLATSRNAFSASAVNGKIYLLGGRSKVAGVAVFDFKHPGIEIYTPAP